MVPLVLLFFFAVVGVWGWSLVDTLSRPQHQWRAINQERSVWLLAILFLGLPGAIAYLALMRPKLMRAGSLPPMAAYPMLTAAPPGWYPDPQGMPVMRWFDGRQWSPQTAPMGSVPMGGVPSGSAPGYGAGYAPGYGAGYGAGHGYGPGHAPGYPPAAPVPLPSPPSAAAPPAPVPSNYPYPPA